MPTATGAGIGGGFLVPIGELLVSIGTLVPKGTWVPKALLVSMALLVSKASMALLASKALPETSQGILWLMEVILYELWTVNWK
jgi:hypothetical protein